MTAPQVTFIILIVRSVNFVLKRVITMLIPENHRHEAAATPHIKIAAAEAGRAARNAPSIIVPSIRA